MRFCTQMLCLWPCLHNFVGSRPEWAMVIVSHQESAFALNMRRTHDRNPPPQRWDQGYMSASAGWGRSLHTRRFTRTITSMRDMRGIKPLGHGNAASAANTGGIYCVWSCSCGQPSTSLLNWVVGFSCFRVWVACYHVL